MARSAPANPDRLLLVEGPDDKHVFWSLLTYHAVPDAFLVKDAGGYETLREELRGRLLAQNQTRLGIVVDADLDLETRWQSVRDALTEAGYASAPPLPEAAGTIVQQAGKRTTVGIWVMPNNMLPGALEEFLRFLVPTGDPLWEHAEASVAYLPQSDTSPTEWRNAENWRNKARMHTYLAWQREPGRPLGQAITARYLTANASEAQSLMAWVRRLFVEDL